MLAVCAAVLIVFEFYFAGLVFILLSRFADGLDGPVARARGEDSSFGGYLDSVLDYGFYALVPLAFAVARPEENGVWAALLLASFLGTGSSFLAFAVIAEKHDLRTEAQGRKSFYYLHGLAEGGETIVFFVLFCLFPGYFWLLALVFSVICVVSTVARIRYTWRLTAEIKENSSEAD
ncbi:MAG: CDP-alcohol phosphatidyltransferase family protein [Alphaproteobacteria bacterium]|nr:CDP-alcohol phosphatidyltransferase family protein [Alphaproteobacteria bacterium]